MNHVVIIELSIILIVSPSGSAYEAYLDGASARDSLSVRIEADSDRTSAFFSLVGRIRGLFGPSERIFLFGCPNSGVIRTERARFLFGCPNSGVIRTERARFSLWLSEYEAHSDRASRFFSLVVRIRGLFGPSEHVFLFGCPNTGLFRTGRVIFYAKITL